MRKIAFLLILLGISMMVYPTINQWAEDKEQKELLQLWEAAAASTSSSSDEQEQMINLTADPEVNPAMTLEQLNLERGESPILENTDYEEPQQEPQITQPKEPQQSISIEPMTKASGPVKPRVIGVIKIDDIQLKLPIVGGVTEKELKVTPGHIPGTALPGQVGNTTIAGHRSYSYGRMFNRLEELNTGSKIKLEAGGQEYEYTVYEKKMVDPTDVSVLNHNNKDKILTLITCDETGNLRLILHAKLN